MLVKLNRHHHKVQLILLTGVHPQTAHTDDHQGARRAGMQAGHSAEEARGPWGQTRADVLVGRREGGAWDGYCWHLVGRGLDASKRPMVLGWLPQQ